MTSPSEAPAVEVVEIDRGFGVPSRSKYDFTTLKVGDALKTNDLTKYQQLRSAATRQGKRLKRKFSVRLITETEKSGKDVRKVAVVRVK